MASQGKTLLVLGGVLVVGIAAALWAVMGEGTSGDDASPAPGPAAAGPVKETPKNAAAPAAARAKKVGNAGVFGEIRRTAGKAAVAGQEVLLTPERGDSWTTTTDADGGFRFEKIPHGGPYELSAASKGCGTIRISGIALDRNEQRNVGTLFLDPSVRLTVRVRTMSDQPVAGALVEAFPVANWVDWDWQKAMAQMGQAPVPVAKATSDANGEASFPEMAVGTWTMTGKREGYASGGARRVMLRAGEDPRPVTVYLMPGHRLDGRVLAVDKKPVAGALVVAGPPNSQWDLAAAPLRARATTDSEGRYAFAALESGEVQLSVAREGGIPAAVAQVRIPLVPHYDITLRGVGTLTGLVTMKEDGKPVEGASVRAQSWEGGSFTSVEAVTDAEGRYTLALETGNVNRLGAEKAGLVAVPDPKSPANQRVATIREGETVVRNLVVRNGARITGVVKGPDGPLAGARVTAYTNGGMNGFQQKSATSGADGAFEILGVEKGTVLVLATKEGHYQAGAPDNWWEAVQKPDLAKELKVEVPETGDAKKDVEMKRGSVVEGVVLGPDSQPLAGARVSGPSSGDSPLTGADGVFRITGVKPGATVRIWASKDEFVMATSKPIEVAADQPATGVTLRMLRQPHVRGSVTTLSGAPLGEARVLVSLKNPGQNNPWEENQRWQSAVRFPVKQDGTYDAALPSGASAQILVRAISNDQQTTDAKPVDLVEGTDSYEVNLALGDGLDLSGKVVAKGGAPLAGAEVSIAPTRGAGDNYYQYSSGPPPVWAITDAEGAFRVAHMAAGKYDVRASFPGHVTNTTTGDAGDLKGVTVELSVELTIEGTVSYADGRPVEGVDVSASSGGGQTVRFAGMPGGPASSTTDAKGAFRITGVAEGKYTIDARPAWNSDVNIRAKRVESIAGGAKDVKIVVEAGASISGRVVDAKHQPIGGAWINAYPSPKEGQAMDGNDYRNVQSKPDGTFTLVGLTDRPYHVQAYDQGGGRRPATLENVAIGSKDIEIVMEDGASISGLLSDPDGKPIVQVNLQAAPVENPDGKNQGGNGQTDSEGRFTISGLAPGNYRISIAQWGGGNQAWVLDGQQSYAAGSKDLRLVAGKGVTISGYLLDEAGKPITQGWVMANGKRGGGRYGQPKGDGAFEIAGLETGQTYTLSAQSQGRISATVENVAAGARDVRIELAKGMEASGRLVDSSGKAKPNTQLIFATADGKYNQWAQSDADGRFTAAGLIDATYNVSVWLPKTDGQGSEQKSVGTIKAGDRDVELRIP